MIERPARYIRQFYPHATWRMDPDEHAVYLTFDDGPIPESTPFILKTLADFNAKATFFMVGDNVRKYPHLFQQIVAVPTNCRRWASGGQPYYEPYWKFQTLDNHLYHQHVSSKRTDSCSPFSSPTWMDAT